MSYQQCTRFRTTRLRSRISLERMK